MSLDFSDNSFADAETKITESLVGRHEKSALSMVLSLKVMH